MTKQILFDVVPPSRRKLTQAEAPRKPQKQAPQRSSREDETDEPVPLQRKAAPSPRSSYGNGHTKKIVGIGAVLIVLIGGAFAALSAFSGTELFLTQKQSTAAVKSDFTAQKGSDALSFEVMTFSREKTAEVAATGSAHVERKASGTITISNAYSNKPYRLIKNTRFESPNHLIFKISDSVTLPATTLVDGKTIPGTVDAAVYAESAGADYNVGDANFTVPGLKGTPQFALITAKSASKIEGGFIGTEKTASEADKKMAREKLDTELHDELLSGASAQIPDNVVLYKDGAIIAFSSHDDLSGTSGTVVVKEMATYEAPLIPKAALTKLIAEKAGIKDNPSLLTISNLADLAFTSKLPPDTTYSGSQSIQFHLEGSAHFVWNIDTAALARDIAGKPRTDFNALLAAYPGVEKAEVKVRPFWKTSFPTKPEEITVTIQP